MKKRTLFQKFAALSILSIAGVGILFQSGFVFKNTISGEPNHANSTTVLLDHKPLVYNSIRPQSRGVLTLVSGNPASSKARQISFRVHLKRGNTIISRAETKPDPAKHEVEISKMLSLALVGDQLIVESIATKQNDGARREDATHMIRVVKYTGSNWIPIRWFPVPNNGDGC